MVDGYWDLIGYIKRQMSYTLEYSGHLALVTLTSLHGNCVHIDGGEQVAEDFKFAVGLSKRTFFLNLFDTR